ncbi:MAG: 3-hydroxybutyryl-CoA dehydrogenase [Planctomycetota bacterium]
MATRIQKVSVVGCGLMGAGIAEVCARQGFDTLVLEATPELAEKGMARIQGSLEKAVTRGKLDAAKKDEVLGRLRTTTERSDLADRGLVIEAIVESLGAKSELFGALSKICPKETIFATNTSSLSVTELAAATDRPARFVGLHFFNPVPVMPLVEVVRGVSTSEGTFELMKGFGESLGKVVIAAQDAPGFVVNRLLIPFLLDAVRALEQGVASRDDIDQGMKLGCGHPMGPLTLLDFVGLDTTYSIAQIMFEEFKDPRYAAPPLLKRLVLAGHTGRKSGRGFYDYESDGGVKK